MTRFRRFLFATASQGTLVHCLALQAFESARARQAPAA